MAGFIRKWSRRVALRMLLLRERVESGVSFNLVSRRLYDDPYSIYRRLREKDPVHRSRLFDGWVLSKHADIDAVLRDHRRFSNDERKGEENLSEERRSEVHSMLYLDPPDHTRVRSLVSKAFTPRAIEALRPRIEQIVDGLLDEVEDSGSFDVMESLAFPLPITVIAEMLGVPPSDRDRFKVWSNDVARTLEPRNSEEQLQRSQRSWQDIREYFSGIIEERRKKPSGDLISALIAAEEEGDKLSHEELLVMLLLLLVAGNETTKNLIGNGLYALLRHPDQIARLRENPDMLESAIEEMLRYDSPVQIDGRTALEDALIGGKQIRKGQYLLLLMGAANRDADAFLDADSLDLGRKAKSHMSFGRGI
ncbi:MAG: cytochrome P450, partial [Chloroflexi bacterium]|nr:cytochrome P450 [Chloroflexota bacterium]